MASEIKVNTIKRVTGTTITVGESGDSVAVTGNIVKSNALQASDGGNIINQCGTTVTLGASGDTIALATGASQTGFKAIDWCTTAKTASPTVGDQVSFVDFAGTFDTNALTVDANSKKIKGSTCDATLGAERGAVTIIYTGTTQGWITTSQANAASFSQETFIVATGGNTTITCGDYKTHIFTGDGPLCVSVAGGGGAALEQIDYMVVAGGGGSGSGVSNGGGGGGAGGYREGRSCPANYTASPLAAATGITSAVTDYTITVGGGGAGGGFPGTGQGVQGSSSIFSTITSAGGGYGNCSMCESCTRVSWWWTRYSSLFSR
jgi:hypothetical protein